MSLRRLAGGSRILVSLEMHSMQLSHHFYPLVHGPDPTLYVQMCECGCASAVPVGLAPNAKRPEYAEATKTSIEYRARDIRPVDELLIMVEISTSSYTRLLVYLIRCPSET